MKIKATISKEPPYRIYIPREIAEGDGFIGEVEVVSNAKAIVLIKPGTTIDELEASLSIIINQEKLARGNKIIDPSGVKACDQD